jgi:hypothetical protein
VHASAAWPACGHERGDPVEDAVEPEAHVDATRLSVEVPTDGSAAAVRDLLDHLRRSDVEVATIALHKPTLDDVFLTMTGRTPDTQANDANDDGDDTAVPVLEEAR